MSVSTVTPNDELIRRIRAASAYSAVRLQVLATEVGWSYQMLQRTLAGERRIKPIELEGLISAVSRVTGLPVHWFHMDFNRVPDEPAPPGDRDRLEDTIMDMLIALRTPGHRDRRISA